MNEQIKLRARERMIEDVRDTLGPRSVTARRRLRKWLKRSRADLMGLGTIFVIFATVMWWINDHGAFQ